MLKSDICLLTVLRLTPMSAAISRPVNLFSTRYCDSRREISNQGLPGRPVYLAEPLSPPRTNAVLKIFEVSSRVVILVVNYCPFLAYNTTHVTLR